MKSCVQCGTEAADHERQCEQCGYTFSYVAGESGTERTSSANAAPLSDRPDGVGPMVFGYVCLAVSLLAGMIGMTTDSLPTAVLMSSASWLFLWLFLVFWSVGYIVKAISFLPGKD